jgi:hypothetical protein
VSHIGDTNKMVRDTPRTDGAQFGTGRVSVNFACQLERELNSAQQHIKRLEEAGDEMEQWTSEYGPIYRWRKAKENKQ